MGDIVRDCGLGAGVDMSKIVFKDRSEIGTFYVFPSEKKVHYQRGHSAWAQQELHLFDW